MNVIMMPCFPSHAAHYTMATMARPLEQLREHYAELYTCNDCRACNVCRSGSISRGDEVRQGCGLRSAASHVTDCIMCGLCASRCRRASPLRMWRSISAGPRQGAAVSPNLRKRLAEMEAFAYDGEWGRVTAMGTMS